ncbi:MAG TPA: HEAT repeat domain-containing protein [Anaerolineales bacterium]|nr:HEAT repeat domain-containing protein [Anaerolineales bacterium]
MPKTLEELRTQLSAIEPDDSTYEGIGPEEVPLLEQLLQDEKPWMAARAAVALSRIPAPEAVRVLERAARDARPEVRVTLAASVPNLKLEDAKQILPTLLDDPDLGVRKFAVRSEPVVAAREAVDQLRKVEPRSGADTAHLSSLAFALDSLALRLIEVERYEEAATVSQETMEAYRRAAAAGGADIPRMNERLTGLSAELANVGLDELAAQAADTAASLGEE